MSKDVDEYPDSSSKNMNSKYKNRYGNYSGIDEEVDQKE